MLLKETHINFQMAQVGIMETTFRQTGLANGMQKGPQCPPRWIQTGSLGEPTQNISSPSLTSGLLATRHSYQKRENSIPSNTSSLSFLKSSPCPLPQCRQPLLCCPAPHFLFVYSVNFSLPQVNSFTSHATSFSIRSPHIWGPSSPTSFRHESCYRA